MTSTQAYSILGVQSSATPEELKKAYRKKAMAHHPDRGGNAEEFKRVNNAYHLLTNKGGSQKRTASGLTPEMEELLKVVIEKALNDIMLNMAMHRIRRGRREKPKKRSLFEKIFGL